VDAFGAQLIDLLNRAAKNQVDSEAMMAKVDGCMTAVHDVKEKLGGWKLESQAQDRLHEKLTPYAGTHFVLSTNPVEAKFMEVLDGILRGSGWVWQQPKADNIFFAMLLDSWCLFPLSCQTRCTN